MAAIASDKAGQCLQRQAVHIALPLQSHSVCTAVPALDGKEAGCCLLGCRHSLTSCSLWSLLACTSRWSVHAALPVLLLADIARHAGERCVQARCVVPQAMPVPLPFPGIFQNTVLRYGDLVEPEQHSHRQNGKQLRRLHGHCIASRLRSIVAFVQMPLYCQRCILVAVPSIF
jgi:hypothetical protein